MSTVLDTQVDIDPVRIIAGEVARLHGVPLGEILSRTQSRTVWKPRREGMYLAKSITDFTFRRIGESFDRDHATVLVAIDKVEADIAEDPRYGRVLDDMAESIKPLLPVTLNSDPAQQSRLTAAIADAAATLAARIEAANQAYSTEIQSAREAFETRMARLGQRIDEQGRQTAALTQRLSSSHDMPTTAQLSKGSNDE